MKIYPKLFTLLCGIFLINLIVWNRLIRIREDIVIEPIGLNIKIFFLVITLIILFYLFIINLVKLLNLKEGKSSIFTKISNKTFIQDILYYIKIFKDSPKAVFEFIYDRIYMRPFIEHYGAYITIYLEKNYMFYYMILLIIPRSILTITLFIDIVIFHQFKFINNIIWVAIIPLITHIILFIIQYSALSTIEYLNKFFDCVHSKKDNIHHLYYKELLINEDRELQNKFDITYVSQLYYIHICNSDSINDFYNIFNKYKLYFNFCILLLLIIIFSVQLSLLLGYNVNLINNYMINIPNYVEEPFSGLFM